MLDNANIMTTHAGMMPKIVRGIKGLKGSIFSFMDLLAEKYRFQYTSIPARGFANLVYNVSGINVSRGINFT